MRKQSAAWARCRCLPVNKQIRLKYTERGKICAATIQDRGSDRRSLDCGCPWQKPAACK